jgi:hypothetical protein
MYKSLSTAKRQARRNANRERRAWCIIGRDRFTHIVWEIFPASMLHRTESAALVVFPYSEA